MTGPLRPAPDVGRAPHTAQPYYVRESQHWAVVQENQRHDQALYTVGEYAMFVLMWHNLDFEAGLVQRCARCYVALGKIGEVYKQPSQNKCPECFGTTYQGGFKARIIRPTLFGNTDEDETQDRRGVVHRQAATIESTSDFRLRTGDYCFRADGTRWWLRAPSVTRLLTGFGHTTQGNGGLNVNIAQAGLEDDDSVAYTLPPNEAALIQILNQPTRRPIDWAQHEVVRAPLISGSRQP